MTVSRREFFKAAPVSLVAAATNAEAAEKAIQEGGLINIVALRASLPRLFTGLGLEIIIELVQNAQRAGSKNCDFHAGEGVAGRRWFSVEDDGKGLDGSDESFRKLLAIGDSDWDAEVMRDQSPLGFGIQSLLANKAVETVRIFGGGRQITIERNKWWNEPEYYQNWRSYLIDSRVKLPGEGIKLLITYDGESELFPEVSRLTRSLVGYKDLLRISCNGNQLLDKIPAEVEPTFVTSYLGNRVEVRLSGSRQRSEPCSVLDINWYGQMVYEPLGLMSPQDASKADNVWTSGPPFVTFVVRQGSPLNLLSPTRRGVIKDSAWYDFLNFLQDAVLAWVNAQSRIDAKTLLLALSFLGGRAAEVKWVLLDVALRYSKEWCSDDVFLVRHKDDVSDLILVRDVAAVHFLLGEEEAAKPEPVVETAGPYDAPVTTKTDVLYSSNYSQPLVSVLESCRVDFAKKICIPRFSYQKDLVPLQVLVVQLGNEAPREKFNFAPSLFVFGRSRAAWMVDRGDDYEPEDAACRKAIARRGFDMPDLSLVYQDAAYHVENAEGFVSCAFEQLEEQDWWPLLMLFWDPNLEDDNGSSSGEQETWFRQSVSQELHVLFGDGAARVNHSNTIEHLLRVLEIPKSVDTVRVVRGEDDRIVGFGVFNMDGSERIIDLVDCGD